MSVAQNSEMLQEAIIDAKALRKAAKVSAEQAILKEYSSKVDKEISKLLFEKVLDDEEDMEDDELDLAGPGEVPEGGEDLGFPLEDEPNSELDLTSTDSFVDGMQGAAVDGEKLCPCAKDEEEMTIDLAELIGLADEDLEDEDLALDDILSGDEELGDVIPDEDQEEDDEEDESKETMFESFSLEQLMESAMNLKVRSTSKPTLRKEQVSAKKNHGGDGHMDFNDFNKEEQEIERAENLADTDGTEDEVLTCPRNNAPDCNCPVCLKKRQKVLTEKEQDAFKANLEEGISKIVADFEKVAFDLETTKKKLEESNQKLKSQKQKIEKLIEAVEITNIHNSKLTYECRILKNASLNEQQKQKIVEKINECTTADSVKMMYEAVLAGVGSVQKNAPKSLTEALQKTNTTLMLKSSLGSERKKEETESMKAFKQRNQKIAGISKE